MDMTKTAMESITMNRPIRKETVLWSDGSTEALPKFVGWRAGLVLPANALAFHLLRVVFQSSPMAQLTSRCVHRPQSRRLPTLNSAPSL